MKLGGAIVMPMTVHPDGVSSGRKDQVRGHQGGALQRINRAFMPITTELTIKGVRTSDRTQPVSNVQGDRNVIRTIWDKPEEKRRVNQSNQGQ